MVGGDSSVRGRKNLVRERRAHPRVEAPVWFMGRLRMKTSTRVGAFTYLAGGVIDSCTQIGRYCSIASGVRVGDPEHPTGWLSTSPFQYNSRRFGWHETAAHAYPEGGAAGQGRRWNRGHAASIGNDVWIGTNAVILRGVSVGDGAVVAAGAVVTKDVEPYTIVGGIPAKPLRKRFGDATIAELLDLAWWRFSPNQLAGVPFEDIGAAIREVRSRVEAGLEPYTPGFVDPVAPADERHAAKKPAGIRPRVPRTLVARLRRRLRR